MNSILVAYRRSKLQKGRSVTYLLALAGLLLLSSQVFAQQATIVGTITDPSGSVIPNVSVSITNVDTGEVRTIKTNDDGQFTAPSLVIGHYNVKAEAPGFSEAERTG